MDSAQSQKYFNKKVHFTDSLYELLYIDEYGKLKIYEDNFDEFVKYEKDYLEFFRFEGDIANFIDNYHKNNNANFMFNNKAIVKTHKSYYGIILIMDDDSMYYDFNMLATDVEFIWPHGGNDCAILSKSGILYLVLGYDIGGVVKLDLKERGWNSSELKVTLKNRYHESEISCYENGKKIILYYCPAKGSNYDPPVDIWQFWKYWKNVIGDNGEDNR